MANLILHETPVAQWHALVTEAEQLSSITLPHEVEGYLVLLLTRFTEQAHLAETVMALDYLHAQTARGNVRSEQLRDVADKCLLIAGLFPQRAEHRRVKISYFVNLGQSAYDLLAHLKHASLSDLFADLSQEFVRLMDVLLHCRQLPPQLLTPIQALELWADTHSQYALRALRDNMQEHDTAFLTQQGGVH
ncbi:MAG: hypothetical protein ACK4PR_11000 [Gammaproteobacteria bacterium]